MQPSAPAALPALNNRLMFRFLLIAGLLYVGWFFGYEQWLALDGKLDVVLCSNIARAGVVALRVLGFDAALDTANPQLVLMNGVAAVVVFPACNGLVLYAVFSGFVLAFPGSWWRKAWFIPAGIALIWCLNVLRVAALAINHHYAHQSVNFNHHYTFNFVVYGCIFGLWMLWARRLSSHSVARLRA